MPIDASQNQQNQQDDEQQGQPIALGGSGGSPVANSGRIANFSSGNPQGQKGSGRFTNLQKYLGANQGAGDRLQQGIGNRINQTLDPKKKEAATQAEKVSEGINQGNTRLNVGQGYQQELNKETFNAQDFAGDENRLNDFSKFRTGQAIDTNAITTQQNNAATANQQAQLAAQDRLNQVGNEAGRFGLMKETFGGRNVAKPYTAGQQRLDQLFLQADGSNKIAGLQQNLRGDVNSLGQNLNALQGRTADINALSQQQAALASGLQNRTNQLETGYIDNLQSQVAGVNTGRDAERKRYTGFMDQILQSGQGKETNIPLDSALFDEAQLREGEQTFNFLKNPTLNAREFLNINNQNAADYRDIAKKQNVDYYNALSQLAGINNSKLSNVGSLIDPNTGELNRAAQIKQGEGSLRSGITKAQEDFYKNAAAQTVIGRGSDSGTSGLLGSGGDAEASAQINLADYLKKQGIMNPANSVTGVGADGVSNGVMAQYLGGSGGLTGSLDFVNALAGTGGLGSFTGSLADTVNSATGGSSGSNAAARYRAQNALLGNLGSTLKDQGFNNYLTKSGAKNVDDLAAKNTAIDQDQLDVQTRREYGGLNMDPAVLQQIYVSGGMDPGVAQNMVNKYRNQMQQELDTKKAAGQTAKDNVAAEMRKRLGLSDINLDTLKGPKYVK